MIAGNKQICESEIIPTWKEIAESAYIKNKCKCHQKKSKSLSFHNASNVVLLHSFMLITLKRYQVHPHSSPIHAPSIKS